MFWGVGGINGISAPSLRPKPVASPFSGAGSQPFFSITSGHLAPRAVGLASVCIRPPWAAWYLVALSVCFGFTRITQLEIVVYMCAEGEKKLASEGQTSNVTLRDEENMQCVHVHTTVHTYAHRHTRTHTFIET